MSNYPPPLYPPPFVPPFRSLGEALMEYLNANTSLKWECWANYAVARFHHIGREMILIHAFEDHMIAYVGCCEIKFVRGIRDNVPILRDTITLHEGIMYELNLGKSRVDTLLRISPQT